MKKRIFLAVIMMVFLYSIAFADSEITFQGVSWLSDDAHALEMLIDSGFAREGISISQMTDDNPEYIVYNEFEFYTPDRIVELDDTAFCIDLQRVSKGKLAGHPVKTIKMSFAYDGVYKLISVKVDLINASYDELKTKLNSVYGDGEQTITDEGVESIIWKGANNTGVLLYTQSEGLDYTLMYGRLDAEEILSNCLKTDPDDVSGL